MRIGYKAVAVCSVVGEVIVGLTSHWPCVTDSGLSTYRLGGSDTFVNALTVIDTEKDSKE